MTRVQMPGLDAASKASRQQGISRRFGFLAALWTLSVCAATVFAAFAGHHWLADLAVQFRLQYAAAGVLGAVGLALTRRPVWAAIALLSLGVNALGMMPAFPWKTQSEPATSVAIQQQNVRVAALNVYYKNSAYERVIDLLKAERPDVAVLSEVTPEWRIALNALSSEYPHSRFTGSGNRSGVLLLSRWPIEDSSVVSFDGWAEPAVSAALNVRGRTLHVIGVHLCWPLGRMVSAARNDQLETIATLARATPAPVVILGDLNVTAFSPHFQAMLSHGSLRSAAEGFGWQPTWPSLAGEAGIQIDHVLASRDIVVSDFRRGAPVGSDHRPVLADLTLTAPE